MNSSKITGSLSSLNIPVWILSNPVFYFRIVFGSESSSSDAYITLPFTSKSESVNAHFASAVPFYTTYTASAVHFGVIQNNTKLEFYNGTMNSITFANLSGKQINGSIVYLTA